MTRDELVNAASAAGVSASADAGAQALLRQRLHIVAEGLVRAGLPLPDLMPILQMNAQLFWAGYGAGHSACARYLGLTGEN